MPIKLLRHWNLAMGPWTVILLYWAALFSSTNTTWYHLHACLYTISQNEDKIDNMSQLSLSCHHHHLMPLHIKTLSSLVLNHFHLDWGWYLPEKIFSLPIMHFSVFIMSSSSYASAHQDPIIISSQSLPFRLRLISTREDIQSSHNAIFQQYFSVCWGYQIQYDSLMKTIP